MPFSEDRPAAVVTGASSGIGKATARMLLDKGWQVIGTGRNRERTAAAVAELQAHAQDEQSFLMLKADFDSMADVKLLADEITAATGRLDVLVNNAGGVRDRIITTAEGTEATFAANHLAPFLLTRELLPLLTSTAQAQQEGTVRVIAVSSSAHRQSEGYNFDDLQSLGSGHPVASYCQAKLANILFTRELARRASGCGIVAQAMHPGQVDSNFANHGDQAMQAYMASADTVSADQPAETIVWLATSPEGARHPGRYFFNLAEETPDEAAVDDQAAARLWDESEALLARMGF